MSLADTRWTNEEETFLHHRKGGRELLGPLDGSQKRFVWVGLKRREVTTTVASRDVRVLQQIVGNLSAPAIAPLDPGARRPRHAHASQCRDK